MDKKVRKQLADELFKELLKSFDPDEVHQAEIRQFCYKLIQLCIGYSGLNVETLTDKLVDEPIYKDINKIIDFDRVFLRSFIMWIKQVNGTL